MKATTQTYIDLRPEPEPDEPKLSPLDFHVRRDTRIVLSYELRKYAAFTAKTAARSLKNVLLDVGRGAEDCFFHETHEKA